MDDRWAKATLKDIPFYQKGKRAWDVIRDMHQSDYVTATAEKVAGRRFGCNGIGKLKEVALHFPTEYTRYHVNPQFKQDPEFWAELWGTPDLPDFDVKKLQTETEQYAKTLEKNGVKVHWVEFPDPPMSPYGPMMGQIYLAWGMIWRGGSIISKMGFIPNTIGLTEYLAKWAWNELNIPVLTAITKGACEPGACLFIAQDVLVTAISCAFTEEGVAQFANALASTSGTPEFHNLTLRPSVKSYFDADTGACAHPDMNIAPVDTGKVLIAPASFDFASRKWLEDNNFEVIEVDHEEHRQLLAPCNLTVLEPGKVIMHAECERSIRKVRDAGVEVIETPGSEILKSGGGIRCRTMQIYREPGPALDDIRKRRRR
ncbi:MAG: arginine deiminase family protein [Candidatus Binatia bacterium]